MAQPPPPPARSPAELLILNPDDTVAFRVRPNEELFRQIAKALTEAEIWKERGAHPKDFGQDIDETRDQGPPTFPPDFPGDPGGTGGPP